MEGKSSGLTVVVITGGLIAISVLLVVFLLILSGFLTIPLFFGFVVVAAGLILLGLSITTGVLSRRIPERSVNRAEQGPARLTREPSDPDHS